MTAFTSDHSPTISMSATGRAHGIWIYSFFAEGPGPLQLLHPGCLSPAGRAPEGMQAGPLSPPGVQAALQGLWGLRGGWKSELVLAWGTIRLSQGTARHHCKSRLH